MIYLKGYKSFSLWLLSCVLMYTLELKAQSQEVFLFSYFVDNGQDGLHFAYSLDGLRWEAMNNGNSYLKPEVGVDKLMRDPCIHQGKDGTFHMVWTTGWHDHIIGYASSKDLIHWSAQKSIPVMAHEPSVKNSWAPEIFYNDKSKKYIIFWASTIPGRHTDVSDSEKEKGLNHRMYFTETKDFKNFSKTQIYFNPNFSVIDATILKNGKSYVMLVKNENPNPPEKNIRITKSKNPNHFPTTVSAPITGDYWAEGPTAIRIGEYFYVYFDKYRDHQYGAVRSKDMISWEDVSSTISFPSGARHGTVLKISNTLFNQLKNS